MVCFNKTLSDVTSMNYWVVRDYYRLVDAVNVLESRIQRLSDEQVSGCELACTLLKYSFSLVVKECIDDGFLFCSS